MTAGIREIGKKEESGRNKKDEVVDSVCSLINTNLYLKEWFLTRGGFCDPGRLPD